MSRDKDKYFFPAPLKKSGVENDHKYDLDKLYERANAELALQQSKRDQILTLYLAIFSFLIPFALSTKELGLLSKGLIFIGVGVIGILFSLITVRYRIYKEVYWLCCETITCLMNFKHEALTKQTIQSVFYRSLLKKGKSYIVYDKTDKEKAIGWDSWKYFTKNFFSAETMHYLVVVLLTSIFIGLGVFLICTLELWLSIVIGVAVGVVIAVVLIMVYFNKCNGVYRVLHTNLDSDFSSVFTKAWFLHLYIEDEMFENDVVKSDAGKEVAQ